MTCIAGLEANGCVYIGGDSAAVINSGVHLHLDGKVFRNGEFLCGVAGDHRYATIAQYSFAPPPIGDKQDFIAYMHTAFVDELRNAMRKSGYLESENLQESASGRMLVGARGRLFYIDPWFATLQTLEGYMAIGVGEHIALCALDITQYMEPEERVRLALEQAARRCDGVRPPFTIRSI